MRLPIRARLTLISGALMAVVLIALSVFLYSRLQAELTATVDAGLRARAALLVERLNEGGAVSGSALAEGDEAFAQLLGPDGQVITASRAVPEPILTPADVAAVNGIAIREQTVATIEEPVHARLLATGVASGNVLVVGASLEDQDDALTTLLALLAVGVPAAVLLASAVGWLVAGAALHPVEQLRREAEAISASEPGRRVGVPATRDELSRLAESLNRMLGRLEAALTQERRFVADASHELRTPLANLRAEIDVALRQERSADELTHALNSVREETIRLSGLADDLLVLARMSEGGLRLRREDTDLDRLIRDTLGGFAGRAASVDVSLRQDLADPVRARVDPVRLRQAIGNLVDNALRHTPLGGEVAVAVHGANGTVEIRVRDTGSGFPPDFLPRFGEGFSRADAARGRGSGGAGLGLTIVRTIVLAHGGRLSAANRENGGAEVTISLPA